MILEVCVDNLISAIEAEKGGAKRLELCSSLLEGGLTPSYGFFKIVKQTVQIPVFPMIRPRGGDFLYSPQEVEIMKEDIKIFKELGADGFIFGCLNQDGKIDQNSCSDLLSICGSKPATFHRAFDLISGETPFDALEIIIKLGFSRILTSGQQSSAQLGKALIRDLVKAAKNRIIIMPGAGITTDNAEDIIETTGAVEFHGSARKVIYSKMNKAAPDSKSNSKNISMGQEGTSDTKMYVTDSKIVAAMLQIVSSPQ